MVGIPGLYFVIACDGHARFVRPDSDDALHTIGVADFSRLRERDRGQEHGIGPPEPREPPHIRMARMLVARIDEDFAVDLFTHLVLVAPPHVLRELLTMLGTGARGSLHGSLAKDLSRVPDLELWPHLMSWLPPRPIDPATFVRCHGR